MLWRVPARSTIAFGGIKVDAVEVVYDPVIGTCFFLSSAIPAASSTCDIMIKSIATRCRIRLMNQPQIHFDA